MAHFKFSISNMNLEAQKTLFGVLKEGYLFMYKVLLIYKGAVVTVTNDLH